MKLLSLVMAFALSLGLVCCSKDVAGTATQTENTIAGNVLHADGTPAKGAVVRMVASVASESATRRPDFAETRTDALGWFSFHEKTGEPVQLLAQDVSAGEILYLPEVKASGDSLLLTMDKGLLVKGNVQFQDNVQLPENRFVVYVKYLPIFDTVDASGSYAMLVPRDFEGTLGLCPKDSSVVELLSQSDVADSIIYMEWDMPSVQAAGDTLDVGTQVWKGPSITKRRASYISGEIDASARTECVGDSCRADTRVYVAKDLFGLGYLFGDSSQYSIVSSGRTFPPHALTDTLGRWTLPAPEDVPYDSFRVEYYAYKLGLAGTSRYIQKEELMGLRDTFFVGKTALQTISSTLVFELNYWDNGRDPCSDSLASILVGVVGTANFIRTGTCDMGSPDGVVKNHTLPAGPPGQQTIVLYPWEPKRVKAWLDAGVPLKKFAYVATLEWPIESDFKTSREFEYTIDYTVPDIN